MTLDEMLMALEYGPMDYGPDDDYVLVPVKTANEIAAALRAGQTMRESIKLGTTVSGSTQLAYIPTEKSEGALQAIKQWDAARMKEDV